MYNKEINAKALNNGYLCFYDKEHPLATEACQYRIFLHRHIASIKLGRWLSTEEHVHHIDGNKLNNNPDNLEILTCSEHAKRHRGETPNVKCEVCGTEFKASGKVNRYCSYSCSNTGSVKNKIITKELLDSLIPGNTWLTLGAMFGYSDVGIKKRAKALGCIVPERKPRKKNGNII